MVTAVASGVGRTGVLPFAVRLFELAVGGASTTDDCVADSCVEDALFFTPEIESFPTALWLEGVSLVDGNNS